MAQGFRRRLAALVAVASAIAACGGDGDGDGDAGGARSGEPLRIGVILQSEELELPALQGAELAIREINAAGGVEVDGTTRTLEAVAVNAGETPELALEAAQRLINQQGIIALVGPNFSFQAIPVAEAAEAAELPMITPGSTNPVTTAGKRFVFRGTFIDPFQGGVIASYATSELGVRTAGILYEVSNEYSAGLAASFTEAFTAEGGEVIATETYTADEPRYTAQLERIRAVQPDVLYLPNFTVVPDQLREARELGISARFLGSDAWGNDGPFFDSDDERRRYLEGSVWTTHWSPDVDEPRSTEFVQAYETAFDGPPTDAAALTYDVVYLLAEALERAGTADNRSLRDALAATDFSGVTGTITYGDDGDPEKPALIRTYADGAVGSVGFFL